MNEEGGSKKPTSWADAVVEVACLVFVAWLIRFFFH